MQFIPTTFFEQGSVLEGTGGITGSFTSSFYEFNYHKFISGSGTFTVTSGDGYIDALIVGGGGRGRNVSSGLNGNGGGGGGVTFVPNIFVRSGDSFTISVGEGGISGDVNGKQSFISSSTLAYFASGGLEDGTSGNGFTVGANAVCGGANTPGGGASSIANGNAGVCSPTRKAGNGADGAEYQFEANVYKFGAGGGGGIETTGDTYGIGGVTGGGNGGSFSLNPTTGSANLGAGGGGEGNNGNNPGNGGRGVVYIRYIERVL